MGKIERLRDLPEWFDIANYAGCNQLNAVEWYVHINLRSIMHVFYQVAEPIGSDIKAPPLAQLFRDSPLKNRRTEEEVAEFIDEGFKRCLPVRQMCQADLNWSDDFSLNELLELNGIDKVDSTGGHNPELGLQILSKLESFWENGGTEEHHEPIPILPGWKAPLIVDLNAEDAELTKAFTNWLRATRKEHGKEPFGNQRKLFDRWATYGVLPTMDLMLWSQETGIRIPRHVMADAVGYAKGESSYSKTVIPLVNGLLRGPWELQAVAALEAIRIKEA